MIFGKVVCFFKGHRRGVRTGYFAPTVGAEFRCPRCGVRWMRKVKVDRGTPGDEA